MQKNNEKPLRVGFDMDGVLLYNPVRIFRPWMVAVKRMIKGKHYKKTFYVPKSKAEEWLWGVLHKTSFKVAGGIGDIKLLKEKGSIDPYLITARFKSLQHDFEHSLELIDGKHLFTQYTHNPGNEQPHLYKERMIKEYDLDVFIDDNWDIVEYLAPKLPGVTIVWLSNMFDRGIAYAHKVYSLQEFMNNLKKGSYEKHTA